jgi:hypothetical protein
MTTEPSGTAVTFIVRASRDRAGRLRGVVERVRTGAKERFTGADGVGVLIERMLEAEDREREEP